MKKNKLLKHFSAFLITIMSGLAMAFLMITTLSVVVAALLTACGGGGGGGSVDRSSDVPNTQTDTPPAVDPMLPMPPPPAVDPQPENPTVGLTYFKECTIENTAYPMGGYPSTSTSSQAVKVVVFGNTPEMHRNQVQSTFENDLIPAQLSLAERLICNQILFDTHSDVAVRQEEPESLRTSLEGGMKADILIISSSRYYSNSELMTKINPLTQYYEANLDDSEEKIARSFSTMDGANFRPTTPYPLIITTAGNGLNECTQANYDLGLLEGLDRAIVVALTAQGSTCDTDLKRRTVPVCIEIVSQYKACDLRAARVIQNSPERGKNWIVVGSAAIVPVRRLNPVTAAERTTIIDYQKGVPRAAGNKPGVILKNRFIATYYRYNYKTGHPEGDNENIVDGTSFGAPLVARVAAEVKRRIGHDPGWTNAHIAELIFETADDLGDPGIDNTFGRGVLNIPAVFDKLAMYLDTSMLPDLTTVPVAAAMTTP